MRRSARLSLIICMLISLLSVTSALAAPMIDFTASTGDWNDGNNYSLGWSFTTKQDLFVDSLGLYAAPDFTTGQRTFSASHSVGIYDASEGLLGSAVVDNNDPLIGFFRYHALTTPLFLHGGSTYYIAAAMGPDQYTWNPDGFSANPYLAYGQNYYVVSTNLAFPTVTDGLGTLGYFGPNADVRVPEPATALILGCGLVGLLPLRRFVPR